MLRDLHVRNLAVIVEASVAFGPGLNAMTGETGAGKSLLVDSLALLSGARASNDLIRSGAETLTVSGLFQPAGDEWCRPLEASGLMPSRDEIVVRREIHRDGRNRVFLDDQPVTLALLSSLAPHLIRIHTQREELGLVSPELQRRWLDRSGGPDAEAIVARVREHFEDYSGLAARLERAEGDDRLRRQRIELLRFEIGEIDAARVTAGEDVELKNERESLRHREAITGALGAAYSILFEQEGAAIESMAQARRGLEAIADWEPRSGAWLRELEGFGAGLEDLAREIRDRLDRIDADPARLDQVEERLSVLDRLSRKYGDSAAAILDYRASIGQELADLDSDAEERKDLGTAAAAALDRYRQSATSLSNQRRAWARSLEAAVHRELSELALEKARFEVGLRTRRDRSSPLSIDGEPVEFGAAGFDQVSYRLAANPGEPMAALSKSASGGELSRIYMAVQLAIRDRGSAALPTLVFDEVDAGIGGAQAAALGSKLARLSQGGQILVVTHLPQVASHADSHLRIDKRTDGERTVTTVVDLDHEARVREVARMLAGPRVTDLSLSHAEEMIATAELVRR